MSLHDICLLVQVSLLHVLSPICICLQMIESSATGDEYDGVIFSQLVSASSFSYYIDHSFVKRGLTVYLSCLEFD